MKWKEIDGFNSRSDLTEERFAKLEDISEKEISKKIMRRNEEIKNVGEVNRHEG